MAAWGFQGIECSGIFSILYVWEEAVGSEADAVAISSSLIMYGGGKKNLPQK